MMFKKLPKSVGYIRMSTDKQEDSPDRQKANLTEFAERDYTLVGWYVDPGMSGTESAKRPEFQRLLRDAANGHFEVILIDEPSRFSREDVWDAMMHWRLLKQAGVRIVSRQRGELRLDDLGGMISAMVDQHASHQESVKTADRTSSGKRLAINNGRWIRGRVFAYDRVIRTPDGRLVSHVHFRDTFPKPKGASVEVVPSKDKTAVAAVQRGFQMVADGSTVTDVMKDWNACGVTTTYNKAWRCDAVTYVLRNPVYIGNPVHGKYARGKFHTVIKKGTVTQEDACPAIVTPQLFQRVQDRLDGSKGASQSLSLSVMMIFDHGSGRRSCAMPSGKGGQ